MELRFLGTGTPDPSVGYRIRSGAGSVAISGDTIAGDGVRRLAIGVDVLVHQALRADLVSPAALTWNASARSVGDLAQELAVPHLVLTHLMPAPADADDEAAFVAEARTGGYLGPVTIARDLGSLAVP